MPRKKLPILMESCTMGTHLGSRISHLKKYMFYTDKMCSKLSKLDPAETPNVRRCVMYTVIGCRVHHKCTDSKVMI